MLVLVTQSLADNQPARVEVLRHLLQARLRSSRGRLGSLSRSRDLPVVGEELLKVLGTKNVDLGEEKLALDESRVCVVQNGPYGDEILELATGLLDDAVLPGKHDGHAGEVLYFGVADDEGVDVEAAGGENAGNAGEDAGLVLDEAVEDMALRRGDGGGGGLVEDVGHSCLG